jgi:hypothetical protein
MSLPRQAAIRVNNNESEWRFDWSGFDGDDCFHRSGLTVTEKGVTQCFDFGSSAVWGLRWLNRFFKDQSLEKTQGGLAVFRSGQDYKLAFEYDGRQVEFHLKSPQIQLDREFIPKYDGDDET